MLNGRIMHGLHWQLAYLLIYLGSYYGDRSSQPE